MDQTAALRAALAPVRDALLTAALRDAQLARARGEAAAARITAEARLRADRILAEARAQGEADATAALNAQRARWGRHVRAIVMRAHGEEYEELRRAARPAVAALRDDAEYPALRLRMVGLIRGLLGHDAELREAEGGGVVGEAAGRRVDYSLAGFADRAVEAVAAEAMAAEAMAAGERSEAAS